MTESSFITVLIAEDNEVSLNMMKGILETQGFKTLGAVDGDSAIKVLEENEVDLAVIDINMAPKGGFEFVKYLNVQGIGLPVVVVTADDSSDMLMEANALGVRRVLQKPIEPDRLTETVRRILKQQGLNPQPLSVESRATKFTPEELMSRAIELADKNAQSKKGGPYGAVVADAQGQILGEGTSGVTARFDPVAHAEVMAIRQAAEKRERSDLSDCVLYCSSEPTMMGKALIASVSIQKVYYGLSHEEIGQTHTQTETEYIRLGHDEALAMFKNRQGSGGER